MAKFKISLYLALFGIALISCNAKDCFETDVAYPGNDLGRMKNKMMKATGSAEGCQELCQKTDGCVAFTFRAMNNVVDNGCWLKKIKSEGETSNGAISGDVVCKVDCLWDQWKIGSCDKSCGGGSRTDTRVRKVDVEHGGKECTGDSTLTKSCNVQKCPVPFIKLWEGNSATQDLVCKFYLNKINTWATFTKKQFERELGCKNDEARSMEICEAKKGTIVYVYDDGEARWWKDDYARIEVLQDITGCETLGTFEMTGKWRKVQIDYWRGGNLDGKVSSMKYKRP